VSVVPHAANTASSAMKSAGSKSFFTTAPYLVCQLASVDPDRA
jgi:hypothetical protein